MYGDVTNALAWSSLLAGWTPDTIVHLAAETGTGQSLRQAHRHTDVNVNGTAMMLDALSATGKLPHHILLASSRAIYGEGRWLDRRSGAYVYPGPRLPADLQRERWEPRDSDGRNLVFTPHDASIVEPRPTNVYAATKLAQEHILKSWCTAFDVSLSVLRLQNVYGAGQAVNNPYTGVLTYFARQVSNGDIVSVFEGGGIIRDFVHVDDVARALLSSVCQPPHRTTGQPPVRVLDVGSGSPAVLVEIARALADQRPGGAVQVTNEFRLGDVRAAYADLHFAQATIGYEPQVSFTDGAAELLDWVATEISAR